MSYPLQPYNSNNGMVPYQPMNSPAVSGNNMMGDGDLFGPLFGLANQLIGEILRNIPNMSGISSMIGSDLFNPNAQMFGISAMNVTQITCGPDGRPHIMQAHDERRMGPGGIWQTKKAVRDPERGIEKMQVGYFIGDRGEVIERQLDPSSGQYRQEIQQYGNTPLQPNFLANRRIQSQSTMQRSLQLPSQQYQYHSQQQQYLPYSQPSQFSSYSQQLRSQPASYSQQPQRALPAPSSHQYI